MIGQTLTIARNTFVESIRQPIFFILVVASGLMQVFNTMLSAYSMGYTEDMEVYGDNKLLLDVGLATVMVCATLLAAFVATSVLSREIENKTALTVISKPIGRPLFVIGKYIGVSGAILLAVSIMLLFLLFAIRHGVMSTARDTVNGPVLVFAGLSVLAAVGLAIWTNYFYGWVFSSTAVVVMLPLLVAGYLGVLLLDRDWKVVPIGQEFKPEILKASGCVVLSMLVLTAVAIAASTRLKQVMTIVLCAGVFLAGLLSNYLLGRYAFVNQQIAVVANVQWQEPRPTLRVAGDEVTVTLDREPTEDLSVGDSFYYGPNPNGVLLAVPTHGTFTGNAADGNAVRNRESTPSLVVEKIGDDGKTITIVNVNRLPVERLPEKGDYIFKRPTRHNWVAVAAWSVVPNLQFFWLVDAITQGHGIPWRYLGLLAMYSVVQVVGLMSFAVLLFQRREVG